MRGGLEADRPSLPIPEESEFSLEAGNPTGNWNLFISDISAGGNSTLNSWSLQFVNTVTPVPEPGTIALLGLGGAALVVGARRRKA